MHKENNMHQYLKRTTVSLIVTGILIGPLNVLGASEPQEIKVPATAEIYHVGGNTYYSDGEFFTRTTKGSLMSHDTGKTIQINENAAFPTLDTAPPEINVPATTEINYVAGDTYYSGGEFYTKNAQGSYTSHDTGIPIQIDKSATFKTLDVAPPEVNVGATSIHSVGNNTYYSTDGESYINNLDGTYTSRDTGKIIPFNEQPMGTNSISDVSGSTTAPITSPPTTSTTPVSPLSDSPSAGMGIYESEIQFPKTTPTTAASDSNFGPRVSSPPNTTIIIEDTPVLFSEGGDSFVANGKYYTKEAPGVFRDETGNLYTMEEGHLIDSNGNPIARVDESAMQDVYRSDTPSPESSPSPETDPTKKTKTGPEATNQVKCEGGYIGTDGKCHCPKGQTEKGEKCVENSQVNSAWEKAWNWLGENWLALAGVALGVAGILLALRKSKGKKGKDGADGKGPCDSPVTPEDIKDGGDYDTSSGYGSIVPSTSGYSRGNSGGGSSGSGASGGGSSGSGEDDDKEKIAGGSSPRAMAGDGAIAAYTYAKKNLDAADAFPAKAEAISQQIDDAQTWRDAFQAVIDADYATYTESARFLAVLAKEGEQKSTDIIGSGVLPKIQEVTPEEGEE
ncbi:MAG: hypothetical protein PHX68_05000 [Alphaproteobacteria bacterium]|nr:hypothetical protein [Alphaproteobacteria bacterium]